MGDRVEAWVQVLILLGVGTMAGAVSFVHVHNWTVAHGQQSWVGWTNAVITELIQVAGGLDLRRRKRAGRQTWAVVAVLLAAGLVSLTAQVSQAEASVSGWIAAALPQLAFLTVVKLVMARTVAVPAVPAVPEALASSGRHAAGLDTGPTADLAPVPLVPDRSQPAALAGPDTTARSAPVPDHAAPDPGPVPDTTHTAGPVPDQTPAPTGQPGTDTDPVPDGEDQTEDGIDADLLDRGRKVRTAITDRGETLTRATLIMGIRSGLGADDDGAKIGTNTATALLRRLKEEAAA